MQLPFFFAKKILNNPQRSFSKFIVRLCTLATIISVSVMVIALAAFNGFEQEISKKIFSFWGHIKIQSNLKNNSLTEQEQVMQRNNELESYLQSNKNISNYHAFATKTVLLKNQSNIESLVLKGIDNSSYYNQMSGLLQFGKWPAAKDSGYSKDIVLSAYTADVLAAKVGDSIGLYYKNENSETSLPKFRKLVVCGIYKTSITEYDNSIALCDISLVRRLYNWQNEEIGGYELFLRNINNLEIESEEIYKNIPQNWYAKTTKELNGATFDWLALQNKITFILICLMSIVAIVNLITCLIIMLLERRKMIAILKTLGANNSLVQKIFLIKGLYINCIGIALGLILGLAICYLQNRYSFIKLPEETYFVDRAFLKVNYLQVFIVLIVTALISFLLLIVPTFLIRKMKPVKLLRFN